MTTEIKTCNTCGEEKPRSEFYKHSQMTDGLLNKCKRCCCAEAVIHRNKHIDAYREYDRQRAKLPHRKALSALHGVRLRTQFPEHVSAYIAVHYAVQTGKLIPLPCFVCGAKAEAHHPDYSRKLDVVWLCPVHHKQAHALARKVG
jgi:hypothetical protein